MPSSNSYGLGVRPPREGWTPHLVIAGDDPTTGDRIYRPTQYRLRLGGLFVRTSFRFSEGRPPQSNTTAPQSAATYLRACRASRRHAIRRTLLMTTAELTKPAISDASKRDERRRAGPEVGSRSVAIRVGLAVGVIVVLIAAGIAGDLLLDNRSLRPVDRRRLCESQFQRDCAEGLRLYRSTAGERQ